MDWLVSVQFRVQPNPLIFNMNLKLNMITSIAVAIELLIPGQIKVQFLGV